MANRKRKGREVSGWLCLDKPPGMTSTQAVSLVKRLYGAAKAGHAGTLDPLATGVLPIAFGDATRTVPFVQDGRKVYRFTVLWGVETDTDDAEGKPVETAEARPGADAIRALLPSFTGEVMQRPPAFSAIKIEGARAYDLARSGEAVVIEERPVVIHRLDLVDQPDRDHSVFEAECGKGTYVRSLARDMGRRLGCLGHVVALRRLVVGPFDDAVMIGPDRLAEAGASGGHAALDNLLKPVGFVLGGLPEIVLLPPDASRLRRGQPVLLRGNACPAAAPVAHATLAGETVAIGEIARGEFHPRRIFR
jgi:tRNA pseudouridine55 synthase